MLTDADPFIAFERWFREALASEPADANAMQIATVDAQGRPSLRTVLLKGVEEARFLFYTNYNSRKSQQLAHNPAIAASFYWKSMFRQVHIEGEAERLPAAVSDAYFATRPRGSQIGAWASNQSEPIASRSVLESRVAELEARFADAQVPRPPHWGGYGITPRRIEFWQGLDHRLHERTCYLRAPTGWERSLLQP